MPIEKSIRLYDRKNFRDKTQSVTALFAANPVSELVADGMSVTCKPLGNEPVSLDKTISLYSPIVIDVEGDHAKAGDAFTVTGKYFGSQAPKVSVEFAVTKGKGDRETTVYQFKTCKVDKEKTYLYMDAKRREKASCMKVYADDAVDAEAVGHSVVAVEYPKYTDGKQTPTGNILVENSVGLAVFTFDQ